MSPPYPSVRPVTVRSGLRKSSSLPAFSKPTKSSLKAASSILPAISEPTQSSLEGASSSLPVFSKPTRSSLKAALSLPDIRHDHKVRSAHVDAERDEYDEEYVTDEEHVSDADADDEASGSGIAGLRLNAGTPTLQELGKGDQLAQWFLENIEESEENTVLEMHEKFLELARRSQRLKEQGAFRVTAEGDIQRGEWVDCRQIGLFRLSAGRWLRINKQNRKQE